VLERLERDAPRDPRRDRIEQELAQLGEERDRDAQRAVGEQDRDRDDQRRARIAGLERERVDQVLEDQRHADVGELGRDQAGERDEHAPAPGPDVGQQLGERAPVGLRRWSLARARRGGGRRRREGGGSHRWRGQRCIDGRIGRSPLRGESNMPEISDEDARAVVSGIAPLQLPDDRHLAMRTMPMPADANGNGDIFGGWIMAQVDIAGAVLPARIAKGRIATVASTSSSSSSRSRWATCSASTSASSASAGRR
jgi:hypothetical protein